MSKLIISQMQIEHILCDYMALIDHNQLYEFHFQPVSQKSILDNIYVGQVERLVKNIQAAFIKIDKHTTCYCDLKEQDHAIYTTSKISSQMAVGDQLLVQVCRDAIKSKKPAVTTNLHFKGKYLILTTGKKGMGLSSKLTSQAKKRLKKWLENISVSEYGLVVRTNAEEAEREELLNEWELLKKRCQRVLLYGASRTCFSLLEERESFCLSVLRNTYMHDLEEIITDVPALYEQISCYLSQNYPKDFKRLRFYKDAYLPLLKLYGIEKKFYEMQQKKVWLKSGGFLVIEPTEALVSIDVNTGKFIGKDQVQETYRKINLEAAAEIARQLRLRNLSGIILIDFISMEHSEYNEELLHVLQKYLRQDPVKAIVHDMTQLNLVEVTRKKVKKSLLEEIEALHKDL